MSRLKIIVAAWFAFGLLSVGGIGCITAGVLVVALNPAKPDSPKPPEPRPSNDKEAWNAFSAIIDKNPSYFGNTDVVVGTGENMKTLGIVSDVSRLDKYKSKMETITDANKSDVVRTVKGE